MQQWYKDGALKPLDFVDFAAYEAATPPGFAALGKASDGKLAGIFTKGAVKGLIWYNTKNWTGDPPATWDELDTKARAAATGDTKQWCIGVESGGDSGWPGTDWIEDFVIRQSGPDGLRRSGPPASRSGRRPRSRRRSRRSARPSPTPTAARQFVNSTNFGKAANPLFTDTARLPAPPPGELHHRLLQERGEAQPADYDFFVMPDIDPANAGSITGGGDLFGMFNGHAPGPVADPVPADAAGPGDLGQAWRLHLGQQGRPDRVVSG